jgi:hypothetical protein
MDAVIMVPTLRFPADKVPAEREPVVIVPVETEVKVVARPTMVPTDMLPAVNGLVVEVREPAVMVPTERLAQVSVPMDRVPTVMDPVEIEPRVVTPPTIVPTDMLPAVSGFVPMVREPAMMFPDWIALLEGVKVDVLAKANADTYPLVLTPEIVVVFHTIPS